jgi:toxin FitB
LKSYLVDTDVISEWQKPQPQKSVLDFLLGAPKNKIFTSVNCIAEITKGIVAATTPDLRRRLDLWLNNNLRPFFTKRILPASEDVVFASHKACRSSRAIARIVK